MTKEKRTLLIIVLILIATGLSASDYSSARAIGEASIGSDLSASLSEPLHPLTSASTLADLIVLSVASQGATGRQGTDTSNMLNSETSKLIRALPDDLPDLIVRQIMSVKGREIRVAVSNLGKANSGACLIRAEVWKNGEMVVKRDGAVKPLHPGQYNIVTIDTSPQEVSENGYIIKLKVDPTDEVKESNENNNSKCKGCIAIPGKK